MSDNYRTSWYRQKLSDQWLCNPLQNKCAVNATTGKTSYNRGVAVHSLLNLPVGPRGNKDLTEQWQLCNAATHHTDFLPGYGQWIEGITRAYL